MIQTDGAYEPDLIVDDDEELAALIDAVNQAEGELIEAQEQRNKVRSELAQHLLLRGERSVVGLNLEGEQFRVTVVSRDTTNIDAEALKANIGARAFNKLTVRKLDMTKVKEAVADGSLDVEDLSWVTEVKTSQSVRLTRVDT